MISILTSRTKDCIINSYLIYIFMPYHNRWEVNVKTVSTNENSQTSKQFTNRKKRIKTKIELDNKKSKLINNISHIDIKIDSLQKEKEENIERVNKIETEELNELMKQYNDSELLNEIFTYAKLTTFSSSTINEIEQKCKLGFNSDNISLEDLHKIYQMDVKINEEIKHTNKINDIITDFGNIIEI